MFVYETMVIQLDGSAPWHGLSCIESLVLSEEHRWVQDEVVVLVKIHFG